MVKPKRAASKSRKEEPVNKKQTKKTTTAAEKKDELEKTTPPVRTRGRSGTRKKRNDGTEESVAIETEKTEGNHGQKGRRGRLQTKNGSGIGETNGQNNNNEADTDEKSQEDENQKEHNDEGATGRLPMEVEQEEDSKSKKRGRKRAINANLVNDQQEVDGENTRTKTKKSTNQRHDRGPGLVLVVGQGDTGQLGLGEDVLSRSRATLVELNKTVVDVCAGGMHTVCLTSDGEVYTFGCNDEGALGRETSEVDGSEFNPEKVDITGTVVQVSAGDSHTAALTDKGEVFVWGNFRDSSGVMGLVSAGKQEPRPLRILDNVGVKKIASGSDHLVLLADDGSIFTCGCAEQGQLGRVAECFSSRGGRKGLEILLTPLPVHVNKSKCRHGFDDIWAGSHTTFARTSQTEQIFGCGLNNYGQLGLEVFQNRFTLQLIPSFSGTKWTQIAAGLHHTLAIDDNGKVYSLGRKEYGRLGLGKDTEDTNLPVPIPKLEGVSCVEVACGISVSYSVSIDGTGFAWGMGTNGQLGLGDEEDRWEPCIIQGKQLENRTIAVIGAGGQHAVMLVRTVQSNG